MLLARQLTPATLTSDFWEELPPSAGVLSIEFSHGPPYVGRTANLRGRARRLLRSPEVRAAARRIECQPAGSPFESALLLYETARRLRPGDYARILKLRPPPLLKVQLSNRWPRTFVTTRLSGGRALYFGPFFSRAAAERFESAFLDLFRIRRCVENLDPDPAHPGCVYGEMNMCLRPCQDAVGLADYHAEVGRVLEFLHTGGRSLVRETERARDEASENLEFESARDHHRRLEKIHESLKLLDGLARDLDRLYGVVVQKSLEPEGVDLWLLCQGFFQPKRTVSVAAPDGKPVSLDRRLREQLESAEIETGDAVRRAEHLALLKRWYYSSWRQGEIVLFESLDQIPYRRLVNAVSRVWRGQARA